MSALPAPAVSITSSWVETTLDLIDNVIHDRVLVYGSLPPEGGDLDLLARPAELAAIREALIGDGFMPAEQVFVRFGCGTCEIVELTPAASWGLPAAELEALFAEAHPIAGGHHLVRPSAHHALLIRARKAARRHAPLQKLRHRVAATLEEAPGAWQHADEHARAWRARAALALLKAASGSDAGGSDGCVPARLRWRAYMERLGAPDVRSLPGALHLIRALLPHVRPTSVIAFSGLDGSGKSSQARLLRDALRASGKDAVVIWAGIGANRSLVRIKAPVRRLLRACPRIGPLKEVVERIAPGGVNEHTPLAEPGKRERQRGFWLTLVTWGWMSIIALTHIYTLRKVMLRSFGRGRIIIYDRYTLDSAVRLRHWYGDSVALRLVIGGLHLLAKRPVRAYFLEVPPQVAFDRKPEWTLDDLECRARLYADQYAYLGVRRLDGMRLPEDLAAEIATDVWRALHT